MLLLNHVAVGLGFLFSPCRLASIEEEHVFEDTCIGLAAAQLFTFLAAFSWKFLDHVCIHFTVTKVIMFLSMELYDRKSIIIVTKGFNDKIHYFFLYFKEFKVKLSNLEEQNEGNYNTSSVVPGVNNGKFEKNRNVKSFGANSNESSHQISEGRFEMRRFDSTVSSGGKIKRTFSKDLFTVDRGKLRARHDER